jgi:hypothetical protein
MACELELDGIVAVLRTVVHDPEFEGLFLDEWPTLPDEIFVAVSGIVTEQFGGRIELSRDVEVQRGSVEIVLTLITVGRVIIEYGALMVGLRELSRLVPDRIRSVFGRRRPSPISIEPSQVILGPTVLVARPANRAPVSSAMTVALSAVGGAAHRHRRAARTPLVVRSAKCPKTLLH